MKNFKKTLITLVLILALFLPLIATLAFALMTEPQFDDTFVGALDEKYERLTTLEGEKIVVVGGSSVAFGLDSARLEEYTGMPVVNFGLYASLGTKLMLDLSLGGIGEGDVVVVSPEMNAETLSLFFNADTAWRAMESDLSMLGRIPLDNVPAMLGALYPYAVDKLSYIMGDSEVSKEGIYLSRYFNEYGDFTYPRAENVMDDYYDSNTPIELDLDGYGSALDEFIDYLNSYVRKCKRRGAVVYFAWSPMNELAVTNLSDEEKRAELEEYFTERLDCEVIMTLDECILDGGYFYDTNFHLNDTGVVARTIRLARAIRLAHAISAGVIADKEPEPPILPEIDVLFSGYDENSVYFTYEKRQNGSYMITGLSELGRDVESLTIPLGYDGYKVTLVAKGALASDKLKAITVTADSNLRKFDNGAFLGTPALTDLYIHKDSGDSITPPAYFAGMNKSFCVHIPRGADFPNHYYWGECGLTFVEDIVIE